MKSRALNFYKPSLFSASAASLLRNLEKIAKNDNCIFCKIAQRSRLASVVYADELTMAFIDVLQFHAGHTFVNPRQHFRYISNLDEPASAAV